MSFSFSEFNLRLSAGLSLAKRSQTVLAFFEQKNSFELSKPPAPLNACVIREVFLDTIPTIYFYIETNLENLLKFNILKSSTPPAPLNVCVIRGVFLCPNLRRKGAA